MVHTKYVHSHTEPQGPAFSVSTSFNFLTRADRKKGSSAGLGPASTPKRQRFIYPWRNMAKTFTVRVNQRAIALLDHLACNLSPFSFSIFTSGGHSNALVSWFLKSSFRSLCGTWRTGHLTVKQSTWSLEYPMFLGFILPGFLMPASWSRTIGYTLNYHNAKKKFNCS